MSEVTRYQSIAEELKTVGNHVAAEAIQVLLNTAMANFEARQEVERSAKRIAELEGALEIVCGIRYQEMRLHLPEGGHVTIRWPESMSIQSAEMLREMFDLQMKAHAKYMANRIEQPKVDAARDGGGS
ncbi:hypothetical protein [Burkholderia gladioli]|uniref:hypothetical protein n=1 Tax=Burkholderia gladioli TaxID=28095 RepID=UPI001907941D|nr:hypothetical protein [Burkholderia gladioli]MBJ9659828.1 hypothetical protein [Burkholderia gladioli]